jgi:hypothetical protein
MYQQIKVLGLIGIALLLAGVACNAPFDDETTTTTPVIDETEAPTDAPTIIPDPTATPDPVALCPEAGEGESQYVSLENGYCMVYPEGFELRDDPQSPQLGVDLIGPLLDPDAFETIAVFMQIEFTGPAEGLDSRAYADRWQELFLAKMGRLPQEGAVLDGHEGVVLRGIPGFTAQRGIFIVVNENKYRLTLSPQPEDFPELTDPANQVWDTVTGSIHFFPPQNDRPVRRAEDVCPLASGDTLGLVVQIEGYCLLYPADFSLDPDFSDRIVGGPLIDDIEPWGEIYTSLTLGTFGYFDVESPVELLEPRMDTIEPGSIEEVIIGGNPAVIFRNTAGPWASRQAMILVDGFIYTIVAQPFEPGRYPDGMPFLDRLWETVTGSLIFFDPWK